MSMKTYTYNELTAKNTQRYRFSRKSLRLLLNIDSELVDVIFIVAEHIDLKIIYGYRTPQEQHELYKKKASTKDGYIKKSKHQTGRAVDILPLPPKVNMYSKDRDNPSRWAYFVGFFQATALARGIKIRTGWKWRTNPMKVLSRPLRENTLVDSNHFEIIKD